MKIRVESLISSLIDVILYAKSIGGEILYFDNDNDFIEFLRKMEIKSDKTAIINPTKVDSAMKIKKSLQKILSNDILAGDYEVSFIPCMNSLRITAECDEISFYPSELDEINKLCDLVDISTGFRENSVNVSFVINDFYIIKN